MAKKKASEPDAADLKQLAIDVWHEAQEADGSRGGQQVALDNIQESIEELIPDVEDYETTSEQEQEEADEADEDE